MISWSIDEEVTWSTLGVRVNNGSEILYPRFSGKLYWKWEVEIKPFHNAKVHNIIEYDAAPIFKEFIETYYEKRLVAKSEKKTAEVEMYKKFMNSVYGKFGQKERN